MNRNTTAPRPATVLLGLVMVLLGFALAAMFAYVLDTPGALNPDYPQGETIANLGMLLGMAYAAVGSFVMCHKN